MTLSSRSKVLTCLSLHSRLTLFLVTESVCGFVAICMTLLRLRLRWSRYWWDDACAFFSLLWYLTYYPLQQIPRIYILFSLLVQIAGVFMHVDNPLELSRLNRIAAYYLIATTFYAVIWSARLSILF